MTQRMQIKQTIGDSESGPLAHKPLEECSLSDAFSPVGMFSL